METKAVARAKLAETCADGNDELKRLLSPLGCLLPTETFSIDITAILQSDYTFLSFLCYLGELSFNIVWNNGYNDSFNGEAQIGWVMLK
jgi:hypothetical protein